MSGADHLAPGVLDALTAAAREVPGVTGAVAAVRRTVRAPAPAAARPTATPPTAPAAPPAGSAKPAELYGGDLHIPDDAPATLQEALRTAAQLAPDKGTLYIVEGHDDALQTYPELLAEAQRMLHGLRAAGLRPGDPALFVFDDNRGYLTAFWACVLGGFVPTPVAVATTYETPNEVNRKLRGAWHLLGRPVLLTDAVTAGPLAAVRRLWDEPEVRILVVEELLACPPDTDWYPATRESPVLNLLTSGSTGVPKCVQHTNASLVDRSLSAVQYLGLTGDDVSLIWMPLDHVTVAHYNIRDVFLRSLHVNAKISYFLADPLLWLEWMDRYRVTTTWAPNFAFAMVNELADEIARRSYDLSCVREIINGAEPVIPGTSHRFLELLAPHGLPADAMRPAFGMSETCTAITYSRQSAKDHTSGIVVIDPASLNTGIRRVEPAQEGAVVLSKVGEPIPGVELRIVDEDGTVLPEGRLGELCVRGRTMMSGYFANDEANRAAFDEDGWFRTGDSAFVADGEVVIAGRIKDQIIVRGVNYLAHELENVVERVDGVRVTFVAAVGVREPGADSDQLVIFYVPQDWQTENLARIAADARAVLVREAGLAPDLLIPTTEAEFPKTSSGKIQRAALADALRSGAFADRLGAGDAGTPADHWFVRRQWTPLPETSLQAADTGVRIVFAAESELGRLRITGPFVAVHSGERYTEETSERFRVPPADRQAIRRVLDTVTGRHGPVSSVVFAWPLTADGDPVTRLTEHTEQLCALLAALEETQEHAPRHKPAQGATAAPQVLVLTSGAVRVHDGDRVDLGVCALPGLVRTADGETDRLTVRQADLPADPGQWADAVDAELADRSRGGLVAARQGRRWQPTLAPVAEDDGADTAAASVRAGGLYLVTGGLGGIAHDIAGYLLADYGVRLLLVGRSAATGERAERLAELSALGEVSYQQLDVADVGALETAVRAAEDRWARPLDGVLHLAGADPTSQWAEPERHTVVNETPDTFAAQYRAKVLGTLAVADVLERRPDASLVLFGSVIGEFGGHSFGAYAAANGFLAGFTDYWHGERGRTVRCLAWSIWTSIGMNRTQSTAAARHRGFRVIEPEHGLRLFLTGLTLPDPYLVVGLDLASPAVVDTLVPDRQRIGEIVIAYCGDEADPADVQRAVAARARTCPAPVRTARLPSIPTDGQGRPDLAQILTDTVATQVKRTSVPPADELERRIATIWSEALERPVVGRDDSFFELGGNSLRGARLLAMVDQRIGVRVPTQELYENPTVAAMAAAIARRLREPAA